MVDLFRRRKWDLVGYRKVWFGVSLAVILTGAYFWWERGLNYGIDFTGGGLVTYHLKEPVSAVEETETLGRAREAIEKAGVRGPRLQLTGTATETDQLLVRTRISPEAGRSDSEVLDEQKAGMLASLSEALPGIEEAESHLVTPVVSRELIRNAIYAVAWGCVFILLWIRFRYLDFKWAGSALGALAHDVLVLIGVFAITQREINSPFVAAALTVVGYSVHDTIVIFDRIRENLRLRRGDTFGETANISLLQTMARSVNTSVTVLFVLVAVYMLGGASLRNFTFALLVGITAGSYSSIFNAAQVLAVLKSREERAIARSRAAAGRPARARAASAAGRPAARPAPRPERARPRAEAGREMPAETEAAAETGAAAGAGAAEEVAAAAAGGGQKRRKDARARRERKKLKARGKRKRRF